MPEAAVNEDDKLSSYNNEVGGTWQSSDVTLKSVSCRANRRLYCSLGPSAFAFHPSHHLTATEPAGVTLWSCVGPNHLENLVLDGAPSVMAIRKLEFYEGAALYRLVRSLGEVRIRVHSGGLILDDRLCIYFKYCTRTRSPWSFTFSSAERSEIASQVALMPVVIGLVCGSDGIAALFHEEYIAVAGEGGSQVAISCSRGYDKHYAIGGPAGELSRKIAPSAWSKLLLARS